MLGINSNINSLVAQQNLNGSQNALSQAITRLSSGKRINSAADDAAGLAISTRMQTQINGLNQGVSNANDGVSMIQTATSGLSQITSSLQRIRQLAVQASSGSLSASDQQALQQEVTQQIAEVNRIASQTNYNGKNVLDGSAGNISFQVGANVGQTINLNLTQSLSAATLGGGLATAGSVLGTVSGISLDNTGAATSSNPAITSINITADGKGGFTFTDQNGQGISSSVTDKLFTVTKGQAGYPSTIALNTTGDDGTQVNPLDASSAIKSISNNNSLGLANGTTLGTISNISLSSTDYSQVTPGTAGAITSITVKSDGAGGMNFFDQNGNKLDPTNTDFKANVADYDDTTLPATAAKLTWVKDLGNTSVANASTLNAPPTVSTIDISTTAGANAAMLSIDSALATVNNIQATLGAAQNRFTAISTTQQAQSTNLSQAQSQIQDANFAQETANLSKAQVLQQAGISVLAQANSLPQQVLKLLQ
ncbi:flagellin [Burkholderia multivorans]|uniref:flagellin n=1 Tax=Burkholderia multivorans TaxID=87883 RepID=UPI000DAC72B2|nr:flagellin [Burkholderia multivorans]MBR7901002.1 flagellin [Burkholderia multivorans]RAA29147.1 flagellin [Burkholderia multivorans]RAA32255.1 flagellin [Burkholderia multivorans]RAA33552.1 flagellin [Burkholderia multivorans]RAA42512.1 flagellin [Burkholderia multivorans]